jgi:hypothetical protein
MQQHAATSYSKRTGSVTQIRQGQVLHILYI